jgi:hypothetical protein
MPDHGPVAVVDLGLLSGSGGDDRMRHGSPLVPRARRRSAGRWRTARETMVIDESCQIAMTLRPHEMTCSINSRYGSQALAVGARASGALGWRNARQTRRTPDWPDFAPGVDASAGGDGGIPTAFRYALAVSRPHARRCLNAAEPPAEPAQRQGVLLRVAARDTGGDTTVPLPLSTSWGAATLLAGLQVSTTGQVSTEARCGLSIGLRSPVRSRPAKSRPVDAG